MLYVAIFLCFLATIILLVAAHRGASRKIHGNQISLFAASISTFALAAALFVIGQSARTATTKIIATEKPTVIAPSTPQNDTDTESPSPRSELQTRQHQLTVLDTQISDIKKNILDAKYLLNDDEKRLDQLNQSNFLNDTGADARDINQTTTANSQYKSDKELIDKLNSQLNAATSYKIKILSEINKLNKSTNH